MVLSVTTMAFQQSCTVRLSGKTKALNTIRRSHVVSGLAAEVSAVLLYVSNLHARSQSKFARHLRMARITGCGHVLLTDATELQAWIFIACSRRTWQAYLSP